MIPLKAIAKTISENPAFQLMRDAKFNEACREAQRILEEGLVNAAWTDKTIWNVSPIVFKVKAHGERLSYSCEFFKTWGFCEHTLAVQLKRESQK